jgi:hypothetical protein
MPTTISTAAAHLPVPLAVLLPTAPSRHLPVPVDTGDPAGLTPSTAARLVGLYTAPGDLVVDLDGTGVLAAAAAAAGRRTTTLVTDRDRAEKIQTAVETDLEPTRRSLARTLAADPDQTADLLRAQPGRVQLLLTRLPATGRQLDLRTATRWLTACRTALADTGYLIAAVDPTGPNDAYVDHATTVITAARATGFLYHQHLIAVTQPLPEPDHPDRPPGPLPAGGRHDRVHADLYVLAAAGGDQDA